MKAITILVIFLVSLAMFSCGDAAPVPVSTTLAAINLMITVITFGYLMFIWERSKKTRYYDEEIQ